MAGTTFWLSLGLLIETSSDFSEYRNDIGIYRASLNNEIVYIGKATELLNGGFRKRLRDYTRSSSSARNYPSGLLMNRHKNEIHIDILVFERTIQSIPAIEQLEAELIRDIKPIWNIKDRDENGTDFAPHARL
jgi:excinuclease UvrABC nuclease subunit